LARGVKAKMHKTRASYISAEKYWYYLPLVIGSSGNKFIFNCTNPDFDFSIKYIAQ
jgi:hypothetical protein